MLLDPLDHDDLRRIDDRLATIGTSRHVLEYALRKGEAGWRRATPDHGTGGPSAYAYRERLAGLRSGQKTEFGWDNAVLHQIELTLNPERTTAIQTMLGDAHTGHRAEQPPRNKYPRGPYGQRLLSRNDDDGQLGLFDDTELRPAPAEVELTDDEGLDVWVLLVNRVERPDSDTAYWHSELSLPKSPNEQGYITDWIERLVLPVTAIGPVIFPGEDEGPGEFDIPVDFR